MEKIKIPLLITLTLLVVFLLYKTICKDKCNATSKSDISSQINLYKYQTKEINDTLIVNANKQIKGALAAKKINDTIINNITEVGTAQIKLIQNAKDDSLFKYYSEYQKYSYSNSVNWSLVVLIIFISGVLGSIVRMFYTSIVNIDFDKAKVEEILKKYSIQIDKTTISTLSENIINAINFDISTENKATLKQTIINKFTELFSEKKAFSLNNDNKALLQMTNNIVEELKRYSIKIKRPKYDTMDYVANLLYGIFGSLLTFIILEGTQSSILDFSGNKDYFMFAAWCVVGALLVSDRLKSFIKTKESSN